MLGQWFSAHGATVLIFVGGGLAAISAFVSERRASGQRELRRKGRWPTLILVGALIGGFGALWAGYGQDRLFDYISGGDSYILFIPMPLPDSSLKFLVMQQGKSPAYDVMVDVIDVTKWQDGLRAEGFPSGKDVPTHPMTPQEWNVYWKVLRTTRTTLNLGNITPGASRVAWEAPAPSSDDQHYDFRIWARNGVFSEQVFMHRNSLGWVWAWRLERTSPQVGGRPQKIDEQIVQGFPKEKLPWK